MIATDPYARGEEFSARASKFARPLYLLAHHDDEIGVGGLLQRLGPGAGVVWVTNSDGRYFDSQLDPPEYGELRKREGVRAVGTMGIPESQTRCLDFSEVEIYRRLSELHSGKSTVQDVLPFFSEMREAVRKVVFEIRPDMVVTMAWQGGQPEHDLTHFFTRLALRDLEAEIGHRVWFYHFPAYEYAYALALRFHPLYRGTRIRLRLTPAELAKKHELIQAYPSQVSLFKYFRWAFTFLFRPLGYLRDGPKTLDEFLAIEEFGPVPDSIDYTAGPHLFDFLTYMFDDFEGTPVTFAGSILPPSAKARQATRASELTCCEGQ